MTVLRDPTSHAVSPRTYPLTSMFSFLPTCATRLPYLSLFLYILLTVLTCLVCGSLFLFATYGIVPSFKKPMRLIFYLQVVAVRLLFGVQY